MYDTFMTFVFTDKSLLLYKYQSTSTSQAIMDLSAEVESSLSV